MYIAITERDKNGKVISRTRPRRMNSYVLGWAAAMWVLLSTPIQAGIATLLDTSGTSKTPTYQTSATDTTLGCAAAAADATRGIVVGTGTNAVTPSDNKLQTAIAHGSGAGQLSYGSVSFTSPTTVGGTKSRITMSRTFTNNSAGNITVNEVAIYAFIADTGGYADKFCITRDLNTFTINAGTSKTVTITLDFTA